MHLLRTEDAMNPHLQSFCLPFDEVDSLRFRSLIRFQLPVMMMQGENDEFGLPIQLIPVSLSQLKTALANRLHHLPPDCRVVRRVPVCREILSPDN
jgi:predicted alpha/beta-hydrolase family hydrolase